MACGECLDGRLAVGSGTVRCREPFADLWVCAQIDGLPRTAARSKYDLDGGAGAVSLLIRLSHKVSQFCIWAARAVVGDCVLAYLMRTLKR